MNSRRKPEEPQENPEETQSGNTQNSTDGEHKLAGTSGPGCGNGVGSGGSLFCVGTRKKHFACICG